MTMRAPPFSPRVNKSWRIYVQKVNFVNIYLKEWTLKRGLNHKRIDFFMFLAFKSSYKKSSWCKRNGFFTLLYWYIELNIFIIKLLFWYFIDISSIVNILICKMVSFHKNKIRMLLNLTEITCLNGWEWNIDILNKCVPVYYCNITDEKTHSQIGIQDVFICWRTKNF